MPISTPRLPPVLRRNEFQAWLRKQPDGRVFRCRDSRCCPIAVFLDEHKGMAQPLVVVGYREAGSAAERPLPPWANEFVTRVDSINSVFNIITVEQLREFLP